jgi:hypothetical protein
MFDWMRLRKFPDGPVSPTLARPGKVGSEMATEIFTWTCPSEGCRLQQEEAVDEYGPAMTLVCGGCDQWFGENDLRPEDRQAWADAFSKANPHESIAE